MTVILCATIDAAAAVTADADDDDDDNVLLLSRFLSFSIIAESTLPLSTAALLTCSNRRGSPHT